MKQGNINWFDVATTLWAIALVVTAVMWVATPASAGADGDVDCYDACLSLDKCEDHGGCFTSNQGGGECWGECGDGTSWDCGYHYAL